MQHRLVVLVGERHALKRHGPTKRRVDLLSHRVIARCGQFRGGEDFVTEVENRTTSFERGGVRSDVDENLHEAQKQADRNHCLHGADAPANREETDRADQRHHNCLRGHSVDNLAQRFHHE